MHINDEQIRTMYLAGTVSVPLIFPELGKITAGRQSEDPASPLLLRVEHRISPRLMIARSFLLSEVAVVFIPNDPHCVDVNRGRWLVNGQLESVLLPQGDASVEVLGIAYVLERARTLMQVEVGMTAAESVDYYPPLPGDRSLDHYKTPDALGGASLETNLCCDK